MSVEKPRVGSVRVHNIRAKRGLTNLREVEDYKTDAFKRSTFTQVDDEDIASQANSCIILKVQI